MENKINAIEEVDSLVKRSLKCLDAYANYTQEQIDYIVAKASVAALDKHGILALHAVEETKGEYSRIRQLKICLHVNML